MKTWRTQKKYDDILGAIDAGISADALKPLVGKDYYGAFEVCLYVTSQIRKHFNLTDLKRLFKHLRVPLEIKQAEICGCSKRVIRLNREALLDASYSNKYGYTPQEEMAL